MPLPQDLVHDMAQFPGDNAIVHRRQCDRNRPEDLRALRVEGADNRGPDMLLFQRRLMAVDRLVERLNLDRDIVNRQMFGDCSRKPINTS